MKLNSFSKNLYHKLRKNKKKLVPAKLILIKYLLLKNRIKLRLFQNLNFSELKSITQNTLITVISCFIISMYIIYFIPLGIYR